MIPKSKLVNSYYIIKKYTLLNMKYIDIHAHTNFAAYDEDRDDVLMRAKDADTWLINIGTKQKTSKEAVELAEKHDHVYAIIGLHPVHVHKSFHDVDELGEEAQKGFMSSDEDFDTDFYRELTTHKKVVGIGECGLDYFRPDGDVEEYKGRQVKAFEKQIELAIETDLPLMIHCRDAYDDVLEILGSYKKEVGDTLRANIHFFAGDISVAQKFLDLGFMMSFTGVITFAKDYEEVVKFVPLDRMMSETDCPYVTPKPYRGKRNEPVYVQEVVKKIAELKGLDREEVRQQVNTNAQEFFGIKI